MSVRRSVGRSLGPSVVVSRERLTFRSLGLFARRVKIMIRNGIFMVLPSGVKKVSTVRGSVVDSSARIRFASMPSKIISALKVLHFLLEKLSQLETNADTHQQLR